MATTSYTTLYYSRPVVPYGVTLGALSLVQCPTCFALVAEDALDEHLGWHRASDAR